MAASFGEQLRTAREARNISLREVSEQTRISMRYLEAIETDDYARLPGGIFNRSFIKTYAKYIGYDQNEAMEGYARMARDHGESPDEVASTPYQPRVYTDDATRSPIVTGLLTIIILAVLIMGVYAGLHWYTRQRSGATTGGATAGRADSSNPSIPGNVQTAPPNQAQNNVGAPTTSASPAANANFNIQIKARGEKVWIKAKPDEGEETETTLEANETREFKPAQRLRIQYAKVKASALEVTINGRPAKIPTDSKGVLANMVISKEDYQQQLQ